MTELTPGVENSQDQRFDEFDRFPEARKREALAWISIIREYEEFRAPCPKKKDYKARKDFCLRYRIDHPGENVFSPETLRVKVKKFQKQGLMGLVNEYGKVKNYAEWPEEAKAYLKQFYLNINRPTATFCIESLRIEAKKRGWYLPSDNTLRRFLKRIPKETRDYFRRGERYWREHYVPSVLRDYASMVPGEIYVSDHAQINVAVRHLSGKTIFPWVSAWMDLRSRKVLSWHLDVTPSGDTINISLKQAIQEYTAPEHVIIDNGRDYSSLQFTGGVKKRFRFKVNKDEFLGIYKILGIEPHFCLPGNPQSKPIERWFWTQEMNFQKAFLTYRGNNVLNRPDGVDQRIKDGDHVFDWSEFLGCLKNYIDHYNRQPHRGDGMNGRSPHDVWEEHFRDHAVKRVSPASLRLLMMKAPRPVKVGRFGISAFDGFYRSDELMDHQTERVIYRYDPGDLSIIYVYSVSNEFLCTADRQYRTAWNDETAYKEVKKLEKRQKRAIREEREAAEKIIDVQYGYQKRITDEEKPEKPKKQKVVRVLRTPFDGIQKQVDERKNGAVFDSVDDRPGGRFRNLFSIERARGEQEACQPKRSVLRLSINDPVPIEEEI